MAHINLMTTLTVDTCWDSSCKLVQYDFNFFLINILFLFIHFLDFQVSLYYDEFELQTLLYRAPEVTK